MADKSINELPVSPGMTDDALLVVYQNGETESIEGGLIKGYARDAVKQYVDGAEKSAKDAAESATAAKKSETISRENADKTAADVVVVKSAADAERERVAAEAERRTSETSRETEEGKRATSEEERKASETTRQESEEGRTTAETERVGNETARGAAEVERAASEVQRVENEDSRGTAEATRQEEEGKRATAETKRAEEESKRAAAESTRDTEEGKRATAETGRETAEESRESAELGRVEAEELRAAASAALSVWEPYDPAKTYRPLNKVAYNGSSYICTAETIGHVPTDTTYWLMIAARGQDGAGVGDMLTTVYDLTGKAQDVFGYADEAERKAKAASRPVEWMPTAGDVGAVPSARKVNGKPLTSDIALTAEDVGALPTTGGKMTGPILFSFNTAPDDPGIGMDVNGHLRLRPYLGSGISVEDTGGNQSIISGVGWPVEGGDAATKGYVDEKVTGALKQFGPVNLTIPVASWTGAGPWTQSVAVDGVLASWDERLRLSLQKQVDEATRKAQDKALGCVTYCDTYDGGITLTCREKKPEVDLMVRLSGEV